MSERDPKLDSVLTAAPTEAWSAIFALIFLRKRGQEKRSSWLMFN